MPQIGYLYIRVIRVNQQEKVKRIKRIRINGATDNQCS